MRREQLPPYRKVTFVMPRWRAVYVSVAKAACTSLKWVVADVQQESRERFYGSLRPELSRAMTIHRRELWARTPMGADLSDAELAPIAPENGWFVFSVVRHPAARVFSAWQSKLLLREPWFVEHFGDAPWFPRVARDTEDIVEDFEVFLRAMHAHPAQRLMRNRHFATQRHILAPDRMPYTRIYRTSEIPALLDDFGSHLREQGWSGDLKMTRTNETPLEPLARIFSPEVEGLIADLYGEDFEAFGYAAIRPDTVDPSDRYPDAAFGEIHRLIDRSERIGDLARLARAHRAKAAASGSSPSAVATSQRAPAAPLSARRLAGRVGRGSRGSGRCGG